jgi:two-component system LytT family response regulator
VIFVTAYEHFALGAFEQNACDYLVKPFTPERFERAAERARKEVENDERLRGLEQTLQSSGSYLTRLALRLGSRTDVVNLGDVSCLLSEGHYTYLHALGRQYISELSLVHLEKRLDPQMFARAHRNALVNLNAIVRLSQGDEGVAELKDGMRIPVSRRNRRALLARVKGAG